MRHSYIFLIVGMLFFFGCSNKVPLGGTVTYSDDGSPVTMGYVVFRTPTLIAQGGIKKDGTYTMGTDSADDGLPPGTYQITVLGTEELVFIPGNPKDANSTETTRSILKIDPKYEDPETSGLTATVNRKTRTFDIQVDRYAGKSGRR